MRVLRTYPMFSGSVDVLVALMMRGDAEPRYALAVFDVEAWVRVSSSQALQPLYTEDACEHYLRLRGDEVIQAYGMTPLACYDINVALSVTLTVARSCCQQNAPGLLLQCESMECPNIIYSGQSQVAFYYYIVVSFLRTRHLSGDLSLSKSSANFPRNSQS